jgi:chorismate mutase
MSLALDPSAVLASMRATIDALDHALLNLLAERRALVLDLYAHKRRHALPLLDPEREARLLTERAAFAEARGVPAALAAKVFRAVLDASHDDAAAENLAREAARD